MVTITVGEPNWKKRETSDYDNCPKCDSPETAPHSDAHNNPSEKKCKSCNTNYFEQAGKGRDNTITIYGG
jgi:hypothetical protein